MSDLEHVCKENWANIATSRCATLLVAREIKSIFHKNTSLCDASTKIGMSNV